MPQVSFLKPPAYQNGHAGNSDPLDEQKFLVDTINQIEQSPDWSSTAIVIAYDDSDGWYDHQMDRSSASRWTLLTTSTAPASVARSRPHRPRTTAAASARVHRCW